MVESPAATHTHSRWQGSERLMAQLRGKQRDARRVFAEFGRGSTPLIILLLLFHFFFQIGFCS
jgi:hypothetical protein